MSKPNKFKKGELVTNIQQIVDGRLNGGFFYMGYKVSRPVSIGWILNMSLLSLLIDIKNKRIFYAQSNTDNQT